MSLETTIMLNRRISIESTIREGNILRNYDSTLSKFLYLSRQRIVMIIIWYNDQGQKRRKFNSQNQRKMVQNQMKKLRN